MFELIEIDYPDFGQASEPPVFTLADYAPRIAALRERMREDSLTHLVIYADRGKMLRFTGPLGFSGMAIDSVTTYEFLPDPVGTKLRVTVNITGQIDEKTAQLLDGVWRHFIVERLKPYVESGTNSKKPKT